MQLVQMCPCLAMVLQLSHAPDSRRRLPRQQAAHGHGPLYHVRLGGHRIQATEPAE